MLKFLGKYKIISLDSAKYIYGTIIYQEKRIVKLVKFNYIKRLKHRYIVLGSKGKEYLVQHSYEITSHCRNQNNIKRLKVISDIASVLTTSGITFIPSWEMKKDNELTTFSRRYIGKMIYNTNEYLVYAFYEGKSDKYIKSIYYDIRKESKIKYSIIFTNNLEKFVFFELGFFFGRDNTVLIPFDDYGIFLLKNNYFIRKGIYLRIKELYGIERSEMFFANYKIDDDNYVVIMPLINMDMLGYMRAYYKANPDEYVKINVFGVKENEEIVKKLLPNCTYVGLSRQKIEELIEEYRDK